MSSSRKRLGIHHLSYGNVKHDWDRVHCMSFEKSAISQCLWVFKPGKNNSLFPPWSVILTCLMPCQYSVLLAFQGTLHLQILDVIRQRENIFIRHDWKTAKNYILFDYFAQCNFMSLTRNVFRLVRLWRSDMWRETMLRQLLNYSSVFYQKPLRIKSQGTKVVMISCYFCIHTSRVHLILGICCLTFFFHSSWCFARFQWLKVREIFIWKPPDQNRCCSSSKDASEAPPWGRRVFPFQTFVSRPYFREVLQRKFYYRLHAKWQNAPTIILIDLIFFPKFHHRTFILLPNYEVVCIQPGTHIGVVFHANTHSYTWERTCRTNTLKLGPLLPL